MSEIRADDGLTTPNNDRLRELGITALPNGHYTLSPVLIRHPNGETQNLLIEVGQPLPVVTLDPTYSEGGDTIDNQRVTTLQQFLSSFARPIVSSNGSSDPESRSSTINGEQQQNQQNQSQVPVDRVDGNQQGNASSEIRSGSINTGHNSNIINQESQQPSQTQRGIRGLDYPAFDVSREGVYNDPVQPTGVLGPLQHLLNTISARQTPNTADANPSRPMSAPGLSIPGTSISPGQESRNIILTVNYVYGGQQGPNSSTTGSLILHVPSINEPNQENIEVLVRLATSIALRTISSTVKKSWGVSKDTFNHLTIKKLSDLPESERDCPICYELFEDSKEEEEEEEEENGNDSPLQKRKRVHDEGDSNNNKRVKNGNGEPVAATNTTRTTIDPASTSFNDTTTTTTTNDTTNAEAEHLKSIVNPSDYPHLPVELNCGHTFGQSCLAEWFKTSNSCPLCRSKLPTVGGGSSTQTTISLPNLASVIRDGREVIDNFNHRNLLISIPDENENQQGNQPADQNTNNGTPENELGNALFLNNGGALGVGIGMGIGSSNIRANPTNNGNGNTSNGLDALASILRDVYNTVAERFGAQRAEDHSRSNTPTSTNTSADANINTASSSNTISNANTSTNANSDIMEVRIGRNGAGLAPIRGTRPVSGFRFYRNVNRDRVRGPPPSGGLFPSGVVSRRSRRGGPVETREIHNENLDENTGADETNNE